MGDAADDTREWEELRILMRRKDPRMSDTEDDMEAGAAQYEAFKENEERKHEMNDTANQQVMEAPMDEMMNGPIEEEKSLFDQMQEMAMVGEEVFDPREGTHEGATLTAAELGHTKAGDPTVRLTWSFLDGDGTTVDVRTNENMATPEMSEQRQIMFREMLKDYGLIPSTVKNVILAHDEAHAEFIVKMFQSVVEKGIPRTITVKEDNGFYRVRVRRMR